MDSHNDDSAYNKNNNEDHRLMTYLRRPYDPASTDMLTIRTSWVRTVHRAAQAYLHQMASTPSASNITEQDILYAFIWHLLTRAQIHGSGSGSSSNHDSVVPGNNPVEVVKLVTIVDVRSAPSPPTHTQSQNQLHPDYPGKYPPAIATVPLRQFLRPVITDETGIPHLRQYAMLAFAIRSAIEVVQAQGQAQAGQEDARRVKMAAKRDSNEGCGRPLCIFSLEQARREAWKGIGYGESHERRMATVEIGSRRMSSSSREDEMEMGLGVHTVYKPSTSASADYHAIVCPTSEAAQWGTGDGKWRVQLHLHPLARQWLRRWMDEKPEEAEIEPRIR
ncbi:hypothetical protein NEUTE1DRAFT_111915 [Neurospora tetrasperma FGSC 2508]|uniref:Uncharacterized protein n=1 Tax=Neurospora tetrasperma (strain FGSC 2508 / ATCC MYA-4615 / P0657) TaxID=510951 RepID=F8MTP5_NEUT8|nr:uncharacterized protein NEUTE1DRAFT_111915 [Neurospora tetrasperma FGSC 2508]EGO55377.1 hypothetical protein NEUTE1DRAFT_111915 [Neurospora tetrasperma FGSC 2508]EGZ69399.1 hypothetical protein NEUTE2DRAFT_169007 [Neurospora tetrasperma FGSC 2509]